MKIARFSRFGFILASAGSAVGLGNIWKFPYITGENGGGAFVMVYLLTVILVGFSIMLAEMLIGYLGRADGVTSFENLAPKHKSLWKYGGFMGMSGLLIMTFYSVVIGWIFYYIFISFQTLPTSVEEAQTVFGTLVGQSIGLQIFFHSIAFVLITYVLNKGIKGGIEKLNYILMPALALIIGGMFIYATNLDGFDKAYNFMFAPDWSKLSSESFLVAIGHAFFTLSLGMGAIMTYSASLPKHSNLVTSALIVVAADTIIALLAGLTLFTFLYEYGAHPSAGPGLVFISLPAVFYEMGALGNFFAIIFFLALAFAGLTSAVSLVEPMVQYGIDRFKLTRTKAALYMGGFFYLIGLLVILSMSKEYGSYLTLGSKNLFDWIDFITASIMLPVGGFVMAVFVGYILEEERVEAVMKPHLGRFFKPWYFSLKYLVPFLMPLVIINLFGII